MEYFYTPPARIEHGRLTIEDDEFAHLTHVMRKAVGDELVVVDGEGSAYQATIVEVRANAALCIIRSQTVGLHESSIELILGVSVLKNSSNFDFLVEKTTELGVRAIVPLTTERTIPHHAKTGRWQKLALAAMKQSGRCVLPRVHELTELPKFLVSCQSDALRIMPHELSLSPLSTCLSAKDVRRVVICIGPEGGFSEAEAQLAQERGFELVSLGPRRLRTETAAIVASARVLGV